MSRARVVWAWVAQHRPRSVRSCEPVLGVPGGGALCCCEGRLSSGYLPPWLSVLRAGCRGLLPNVLPARVCGRGDPALSLWLVCPAGGCSLRGWWEAEPGGVAFYRCEGLLVSGAVPPKAARPLGRAARLPQPVFPGGGWCGRGGPGPAPQRALLRAVVERSDGGGRASPGGAP